MNKIISVLKYLIGWPLSLISILFIFKLIYANVSSLNNLKNINYSLLFLGIICFLIYFFLRSVLWYQITKNKGNKHLYPKSAYFWEISEIKRYIPGNIWSFLSRSKLFSENNMTKGEIAYSLFNETVLIVLGCFLGSVFYISYLFNNLLINKLLILLFILSVLIYVFADKINKRIKLPKFIEKIKLLFPGDNYSHNFEVSILSFLAFLMFGLATYFSATSIFYLNPKYILELISLSIFSLLIGYLSVVTPMGLGVREGVMTFGLSNFISLSSSGIISIFSRIVFVLSEVLFLIILWLWEKIKNPLIVKTENFLIKHKHEAFLFIFILLYILYFSVASFLRYDNFYTGRFDLGNMDQTVWNTINGRIFQMTDPNATETVSRLNFHSDFILILISPLYLIWSNPKMLLLLQTMVLGSGALFVFLIAKELLKEKNLALTFSLLFLLNPSVQFTNLYDFHAVALGTTLLLATFYFFIKKSYILFLFFALLSGFSKEEIWVIVSLFGLALVLRVFFENKFKPEFSKKQLVEIFIGLFLFLTSAIIFYLLIWVIMPQLRGASHFALSYYSGFGDSPSEVSRNIILMPVKTISIIFSPQRVEYLVQLFLPFGFTSFLSPVFLIFAIPDLLINLLSSNKPLREIYYQYTSAITPFIIISAIYAINFLKKRFVRIENNFVIFYLVTTTLLSAYFYGPLPGGKHANIQMFNNQLSNRIAIEDFISKIPENYSVTASNNLGSHLSHRKNLYNTPIATDSADMILFLLNDYWAQPPLSVQKQMAKNMESDKNYILIFKSGDFVAFAKRKN